jgi:hypothetical protein
MLRLRRDEGMATQPQPIPAPARLRWRDYIVRYWRYRAADKRDQRLDLLRGFCIFVMVVDHIGGVSPLRALTGGGTFFVSAAEGFVFISGLLLGEVYRKVIEREGFRAAITKAWRRSLTLYLLTFTLTFVLTYVAWWLGIRWAEAVEIENPLLFALRVLTLQRPYIFTDVLVMYTLLILGAPIALWLLHRGWVVPLLAGSWLLWLLYQITPESAGQPLPYINTFHPAAWQIFFVHAMALGYHRQRMAAWFRSLPHAAIFVCCVALFTFAIVLYRSRGAVLDPLVEGNPATLLEAIFLKNPVRVGRIVTAAVVFSLAYIVVTYAWYPLRRWLGWLLLPLGENSLYSYTMHLPVLVLLSVPGWPPGETLPQQLLNAGIQLFAVALIWLMIRYRFAFRVIPR